MSAPPPRWPTGPGRSSPPSAPWAPTAPTLVGRAAIGASGLGLGGGLAGAGGGGGEKGASASAQQPACERAWAAIRVRGAAASMCVRFEHATAAHAVASEPAELLAGKRVVERGARLPAALEGAGVLGHREQGEQGEQGNACQPHPGRSRSWGVGDHDLQRGRAEGCVVGDTGMEPATSGSAGHSSTQPRHWGTRRWMPASTARARRACACAEPVMQAELEGFACARGAA